MKKLIILSLLLTGCYRESDSDRFDRFMTELECPVILIGKTDKAVTWPSIVVRDGKGRVRTFSHYHNGSSDSQSMPAAIADSRNIGDTLKPCSCIGAGVLRLGSMVVPEATLDVTGTMSVGSTATVSNRDGSVCYTVNTK